MKIIIGKDTYRYFWITGFMITNGIELPKSQVKDYPCVVTFPYFLLGFNYKKTGQLRKRGYAVYVSKNPNAVVSAMNEIEKLLMDHETNKKRKDDEVIDINEIVKKYQDEPRGPVIMGDIFEKRL